MKNRKKTTVILITAMASSTPALANNIGENGAWQFETATDMANRAALENMRQQRASGYYSAPHYTTNIGQQFNCSLASVATGNQGSVSATGNSPSTAGNSSSSTGNASSTSAFGASGVTGNQQNGGSVGSWASGGVSASVRGDSFQALNTTQTNSGAQTSGVTGSDACKFGPLN